MDNGFSYPGYVARFFENGYHMGQTKYSSTWQGAVGLAQLNHSEFTSELKTESKGPGERRVFGTLTGITQPWRVISFSVVWVDEGGKDHYTY